MDSNILDNLDLHLIIHPDDVDFMEDFILNNHKYSNQTIIFIGDGNNGITTLENRLVEYTNFKEPFDPDHYIDSHGTYIIDFTICLIHDIFARIETGYAFDSRQNNLVNITSNIITSTNARHNSIKILSERNNVHIIRFPYNINLLFDSIANLLNRFLFKDMSNIIMNYLRA